MTRLRWPMFVLLLAGVWGLIGVGVYAARPIFVELAFLAILVMTPTFFFLTQARSPVEKVEKDVRQTDVRELS